MKTTTEFHFRLTSTVQHCQKPSQILKITIAGSPMVVAVVQPINAAGAARSDKNPSAMGIHSLKYSLIQENERAIGR